MDVEGVWNPPELWPESSPPLPGWTRDERGHWREPAPLSPPPLPLGIAPQQPVVDDRLELGYIEYEATADADAEFEASVEPGRALGAAAIAAGIALLLIIILLLIT